MSFWSKRAYLCAAPAALAVLAGSLLLFLSSAGALASPQAGGQGRPGFAPQFAIADFDGDHRPDLANVRADSKGQSSVLYLIDFRLSSGLRRTFGVTASAGGLQLASRDVNGDHLLDVVVSTFLTDEPVAVFLSDGRGDFTRSEPSAFPAAFTASDQSFSGKTSAMTDGTGTVPSRMQSKSVVLPAWLGSPRNAAASLAASDFPVVRSSGRNVRIGRAPPAA
jgi:hypothetical protein